MKIKKLSEIKFGERVNGILPATYSDVVRDLGLDSKSAQKVLADLQKYGYISKDERGFYHSRASTEPTPDRYVIIGASDEEARTD